VKLFEFAIQHFSKEYTYASLREEAERLNVLSNDSIRTFIPIFKGLGYVDYKRNGTFKFLNDGILFYYIQKSIFIAQDLDDEKRQPVLTLLEDAKLKIVWKGLLHLYKLDDDNSRKFQIIIQLLNKFGQITIQEYLYAVYFSLENNTIDFNDINNAILERREKENNDEIYSWNRNSGKYEPVKETATCYLKDLLRVAELLKDIDSATISASDNLLAFISILNQ